MIVSQQTTELQICAFIFTNIHYCYIYIYIHYIGKSIGSPSSNERFDYFSNVHEYKS